jgi:hypothetical protein
MPACDVEVKRCSLRFIPRPDDHVGVDIKSALGFVSVSGAGKRGRSSFGSLGGLLALSPLRDALGAAHFPRAITWTIRRLVEQRHARNATIQNVKNHPTRSDPCCSWHRQTITKTAYLASIGPVPHSWPRRVRVECVDPRALIYDNCKMRHCVAVRGYHL